MKISFEGRTVLVTGASTGIGAALAQGFARAGAAVAVHYNASVSAADEVVRAIEAEGGRAVAVQADLSASADHGSLVAESSSGSVPSTCWSTTPAASSSGRRPAPSPATCTTRSWSSTSGRSSPSPTR